MTNDEKIEQFRAASVDFVNVLCDPAATPFNIKLAAMKAAMAQFTLMDDLAAAQTMIERLRKMFEAPK